MASDKPEISGNHSKFRCNICGKEFENLGDMQRHETVEHIQKGEIK